MTFTCHRWAHGWDRSHILTGAHGCTPPDEAVSSDAANTGPERGTQKLHTVACTNKYINIFKMGLRK